MLAINLMLFGILFLSGCGQQSVVQMQPKSPVPGEQAPTASQPVATQPTQDLEKCGIENCHGLDITCGSNVPEMCTMSYMIGDKCRQYASCEKKDGRCQLADSPKFESCKSCVEKCKSEFNNDPGKLFTCEGKCGG